ncbi:Uncharacterized protein GBIM_11688 [Gryllus bimaculatus]|nr:Uncharacterized protein GBIM_11688 [Gryllus bimaculatus]
MENLLEMCANVAVLIKFAALSRRGRAKRNGAGARRVCGWLVCAGGGGGALAARWQGGRPLALLDCRVHKRTEVVLQTRDNDGEPLCHGGEKIAAELRHRDASRKSFSRIGANSKGSSGAVPLLLLLFQWRKQGDYLWMWGYYARRLHGMWSWTSWASWPSSLVLLWECAGEFRVYNPGTQQLCSLSVHIIDDSNNNKISNSSRKIPLTRNKKKVNHETVIVYRI